MRASHVLELINERDQLRRERDRYRTECHIERAAIAMLFVSCVAVMSRAPWFGLLLGSALILIALFLAGLLFAAKRGDAAMGIGDTQGRDFPASPNHTTPLSEAHSEGPKDPLQSV